MTPVPEMNVESAAGRRDHHRMTPTFGQNGIVRQPLRVERQSNTTGGVWLRAVRRAQLSDSEAARRQRQLLDLLLCLMDELDHPEGAWAHDRAA
jgi:hypothetical protein